ncbi:MAG: sigma-70 family RNA polymerase sigma factor [Bacteroidetes bacterium]|nr:sigma-70 family RNA polymerase sigma factor [Bacteroidota bacterium]
MRQEILYTDSSLLSSLAKSEQWAFEAIYSRYFRQLMSAAYIRLKDQQQSEDVVQNVFLKLWKNREQLTINNLAAYLNVAVRYEVLNLITRSKTPQYFHKYIEEVIVDADTADGKIIKAELMNLVCAYAQTLPEKRKNILILHLQKNWSTKEISGVLGISQKTVQNQLRMALNGLSERISL